MDSFQNGKELAKPPLSEALRKGDTGVAEVQLGNQSTSRMELPMILNGSVFVSRPDSGSEQNIISVDIVNQLGTAVNSREEHQREFRLGNGKVIKALGRVTLDCSFAIGPHAQLSCSFYVFQFLITPLIMGMSFLDETETLSKYRHRLRPRSSVPRGIFQLCSINNPRRRLCCFAEGHPTLANADTGSEVDLISLDFARRREFFMTPASESWSKVQFADGEISPLEGKVTLCIHLGSSKATKLDMEFYVLKNLTCDMLFGEEILYDTDAFRTYREDFEVMECEDFAELNTIAWFGSVERFLSKVGSKAACAVRGTASAGSRTGIVAPSIALPDSR